jgi:hypothetical protein
MGLWAVEQDPAKIARTHQANDLRNCLLDEKQVRLKGNELTKYFLRRKEFLIPPKRIYRISENLSRSVPRTKSGPGFSSVDKSQRLRAQVGTVERV